MKKTIIVASLAVFASAAVLATFALGGAGKFGDVQVNADTDAYSVTFNAGNTSCTLVEIYEEQYIAFTTTTDNGNKVGVVGCHIGEGSFTFNDIPFRDLWLCDYDDVLEGRAYQFSTITGFAISFEGEGEGLNFESMDKRIYEIESRAEYKGLSIDPSKGPMFRLMIGSITVTSLTIYYTCSQ